MGERRDDEFLLETINNVETPEGEKTFKQMKEEIAESSSRMEGVFNPLDMNSKPGDFNELQYVEMSPKDKRYPKA